jgi:hypothetical protein
MIIRFTVDLPFALKKKCVEELKKMIKEEVNRAVQAYGVFEVIAKVKPKGAPTGKEEEEVFEGKKFWFEEAIEGG